MKKFFFWLLFFGINNLAAQPGGQTAMPKPSAAQLAWHEMEYYFFIHFGPNTFTGKEWGHGDEPEDIFNPSALDCRQWARIAKASGAKGIIITAKHHDGFCLWPSQYSRHTVRESKWKNGKGDVLKELSAACREAGLKFGVYISPWDRNHPDYGTEKYNEVFVNMMKEIFTAYGPIWELWWDGANGEGPNGKRQVYDWHRFKQTVKSLSPHTIIFSDTGPHARWVGNEKGIAGITNWNYLDTAGFTPGLGAPHTDTLNQGNINGKAWIPAECDVSIRPGWFYHSNEDDKVKKPEEIFQLYLKSVGRGANLLLNIPPDTRGLIHENDSAALVEFKKLREQSFAKNLLAGVKASKIYHYAESDAPEVVDNNPATYCPLSVVDLKRTGNELLHLQFSRRIAVNCIVLQEAIQHGQSIGKFEITFWRGQQVLDRINGTTIGRKRIISFPTKEIDSFSISVLDARGKGLIREVAAYMLDENLLEK
jgi:alpha-L-fucosidase